VIDPADGSLSPFVIPQGSVLVLTGGTWSTGGLPAGSASILEIFLTTPSTDRQIVFGPSVLASATTSVDNWAAAAFTLQPGIVVRPGASLCVGLRTDNSQRTFLTLRLFGYITKDK
jgi:hypothetical protein